MKPADFFYVVSWKKKVHDDWHPTFPFELLNNIFFLSRQCTAILHIFIIIIYLFICFCLMFVSHGSLLIIGKKMYAYLDLMNVGLFAHARKTIYFDVSL